MDALANSVVMDPRLSVSVVIPAFNVKSVIGTAIESVQCQSICPDEILVCDDGSTDGTGDFARSLGATVLAGPKANGNVARNRGIMCAKGEIVMMLDGDDWWHPRKVEAHLLAHRSAANASFVYDPAVVVRKGVMSKKVIGMQGAVRPSWEHFLDWRSWASGSSFSFNRHKFVDIRLCFNENLIAQQDVDFWVRASYRFGPAYRIDAPFTFYRISPGTVSRSPDNVSANLDILLSTWPFLSRSQASTFRIQTFLTAARFSDVRQGAGYLDQAGWPIGNLKFWKTVARMLANTIGNMKRAPV